jgi:crotonobetainyl-CoA:carnitine CoA-transferase CaiB-like acyl-CoA transferase
MSASHVPVPDRVPRPNEGRAALTGIRVIDFSRMLSGPFGTQILGDLGAEVIKVEDPGKGDDTRIAPANPALGGEGFMYLSINRNKKSVAIDLRSEEGRQVVLDLIGTADVLVENFTTKVMKRFGLDYASVRDRFPRLIYCSISGYGRTGSHADAAGFDSVVAAEAGVHWLNSLPDSKPVLGAVPYTDTTAGMNAAIGVLAALHARNATGRGQHVDIAMYDTALANLSYKGYEYLASGNDPALVQRQNPGPRGEFETADGSILITTHNDKAFGNLAQACGHPEWIEDERFANFMARMQNGEALLELFRPVIASQTSAYWSEKFKAVAIPCGVVRSPGEALTCEYTNEMNLVYALPHPTAGTVPSIAHPYRLSETPGNAPVAPPLLGEHTGKVLSDLLGYDEAKIAALAGSGSISVRAPGE